MKSKIQHRINPGSDKRRNIIGNEPAVIVEEDEESNLDQSDYKSARFGESEKSQSKPDAANHESLDRQNQSNGATEESKSKHPDMIEDFEKRSKSLYSDRVGESGGHRT